MRVQEIQAPSNRVFTVPNLLSLLRLLGVPLFLWLVLWPNYGGPKHDLLALLVLALGGATDYLDGKLARRWNQVTRLGQMLDPTADRLYIIATLVGLTARDIIPLAFAAVLVARDVVLLGMLVVARRHGIGPPQVAFIGKAATFNLLYAFPLLLLGDGVGAVATVASIFGWAFAIWGSALYWWAGVLYMVQVRHLVKFGTRA